MLKRNEAGLIAIARGKKIDVVHPETLEMVWVTQPQVSGWIKDFLFYEDYLIIPSGMSSPSFLLPASFPVLPLPLLIGSRYTYIYIYIYLSLSLPLPLLLSLIFVADKGTLVLWQKTEQIKVWEVSCSMVILLSLFFASFLSFSSISFFASFCL